MRRAWTTRLATGFLGFLFYMGAFYHLAPLPEWDSPRLVLMILSVLAAALLAIGTSRARWDHSWALLAGMVAAWAYLVAGVVVAVLF